MTAPTSSRGWPPRKPRAVANDAFSAVPSASMTSTKNPWPDSDVSRVAFRLRANGYTEFATRRFLDGCAWNGVRRLAAYVDNFTDERLAEGVEGLGDDTRIYTGSAKQRGDIVFVRTPSRWPWPIRSSQLKRGHKA
jgi:hypothetical protein